MYKKILGLTLGLLLCLSVHSVWAAAVTLAWNANRESDLAGYRVYQSTVSGQYTKGQYIREIPAGTTTCTLSNVSPGTYFWKLTAFDAVNNESGFSNEVSTVIAGAPGKPGTIRGRKIDTPKSVEEEGKDNGAE